jgi:hypothetical protein
MKLPNKILFTVFFFILLMGSCIDFFNIAWGTGIWLGGFAFTWGLFFCVFCASCSVLFFFLLKILWRPSLYLNIESKLISLRQNNTWVCLFLSGVIFVFPIWFLQFSLLGLIFHGFYLRLSLWIFQLFLLSYFISAEDDQLVSLKVFLYLMLITASSFSIMSSLGRVTDYPFSLGWSEGNRLWDYSILFGSARYDFPQDKKIYVLLDIGRQLVGGIPFLFPGLTIKMERLWVGLTLILPYMLLGLVAFRSFVHEKYLWLAMVLWAGVFLKQGPIHPPLILSAVLVAFAWRSRFWLSIPLVAVATYTAYVSRYTWTFAPGIWFMMLELVDGFSGNGLKFSLTSRIRSLLSLLLFGMTGALVFLGVGACLQLKWVQEVFDVVFALKITPQYVLGKMQQQPLLWYRLFPNETYGIGVLAGLVFSICPLILILFYLIKTKKWKINGFQKLILVLPVFVFFVVGAIVSVKIGGGGDLHNMDMLLITLFFVVMMAVHSGIGNWLLQDFNLEPLWIISLLIMSIAIPTITPLMVMRSYSFGSVASWLKTLADVPNERSLDMYPANEVINDSLQTIQLEANLAKLNGDVLFMDQRQLLTFGFVRDIPLVPEYDKKVLMERAITSNKIYFSRFYDDLKKKRFTLVVVQPLNTPQKGSDSEFGEENDAWVKWVSVPLLCFYEVKQTLLDVNVQLLVPRSGVVDCIKVLP